MNPSRRRRRLLVAAATAVTAVLAGTAVAIAPPALASAATFVVTSDTDRVYCPQGSVVHGGGARITGGEGHVLLDDLI